jgi:hypothetical protein
VANEVKQQQRPASPEPMPTMPTRKGWEDMAQEELWSKGWKPTGYDHDGQVMWRDPQGSDAKPERKFSHKLKDENGNEISVMQTFGAPIPWNYRTAEAYEIQSARDKWEADAPKRAEEARTKEERRKAWQQELANRRARRAGVMPAATA